MLGVEPNYLLYSEVSPHWTPVHNAARRMYVARGIRRGGGDDDYLDPPWWGIGGSEPQAKNRCQISL